MCLHTFHHTTDEIAILRIQIRGPICLSHCVSQEVRLFWDQGGRKMARGAANREKERERRRENRSSLRERLWLRHGVTIIKSGREWRLTYV